MLVRRRLYPRSGRSRIISGRSFLRSWVVSLVYLVLRSIPRHWRGFKCVMCDVICDVVCADGVLVVRVVGVMFGTCTRIASAY